MQKVKEVEFLSPVMVGNHACKKLTHGNQAIKQWQAVIEFDEEKQCVIVTPKDKAKPKEMILASNIKRIQLEQEVMSRTFKKTCVRCKQEFESKSGNAKVCQTCKDKEAAEK